MLKSLKINNYTLITSLEINFHQGMTSITGETGAGKSILLDGLGLVLGKRANLNAIKDLNKKCLVEAEFDIQAYQLNSFFDRHDLDYDPLTIVRREITPSGKSRAFINDTPVTLNLLEELSQHLIDIHGQMENASLFQKEFQFLFVDAYAEQQEDVNQFEEAFKHLLNLQKSHASLLEKQKSNTALLSLNRFYFDELEAAQLDLEEFEKLQTNQTEIQHLDFINESLAAATERLEAEPGGLLSELFELRALIHKMTLKSNRAVPLFDHLQNILSEIEDLRDKIHGMRESVEFNPEEQQVQEAKLNQYNTLLHKHQAQAVEDLISLREQLRDALKETDGLDEKIKVLENEIKSAEVQLQRKALLISQRRQAVLPKLGTALETLVARMGMPEARFKMVLEPQSTLNKKGKDDLQILFCANPGSDFQELKKTASGGERSRIMLALKAILAQYRKLPTLIFDEIDTGVSGKVSDQIASIMAELAAHMQLFVITHLPQVAAKGTHHLKVLKQIEGETTQTLLKKLNREERALEIAQMLSGNETGTTALAHARELLK